MPAWKSSSTVFRKHCCAIYLARRFKISGFWARSLALVRFISTHPRHLPTPSARANATWLRSLSWQVCEDKLRALGSDHEIATVAPPVPDLPMGSPSGRIGVAPAVARCCSSRRIHPRMSSSPKLRASGCGSLGGRGGSIFVTGRSGLFAGTRAICGFAS